MFSASLIEKSYDMRLYWLVRCPIDFRWIGPVILYFVQRLKFKEVVVDISLCKSLELEVKSYFSNVPLCEVICISKSLTCEYFLCNVFDVAVFEWGTGYPKGILRLFRQFSIQSKSEKYRRGIISAVYNAKTPVSIALPHGYNVKLNAITREGLKPRLTSLLKLARDRQFFDIYGYETSHHKEKMISDGLSSRALIKIPPLFAAAGSSNRFHSTNKKDLFIFPKLQNKINESKLVKLLKSLFAEEVAIALHPREEDQQRSFLEKNGLHSAFSYTALGSSPHVKLQNFRRVYDVGSSIGLFCAFANIEYFLLTGLSNNSTIFDSYVVHQLDSNEFGSLVNFDNYIAINHSSVNMIQSLDILVENISMKLDLKVQKKPPFTL